MNDSEFRDWIRGELGGFRERLTAMEARLPNRMKLGRDCVSLANDLMSRIKAGKVSSLAVVLVTDEGPVSGWATGGDLMEHTTLLGAVEMLIDDLRHPEDRPDMDQPVLNAHTLETAP